MDKRAITYTTRSDAPPETEISALANVYRFVLDRKEAATSPVSHAHASVRGTEEVSHVERRPD